MALSIIVEKRALLTGYKPIVNAIANAGRLSKNSMAPANDVWRLIANIMAFLVNDLVSQDTNTHYTSVVY